MKASKSPDRQSEKMEKESMKRYQAETVDESQPGQSRAGAPGPAARGSWLWPLLAVLLLACFPLQALAGAAVRVTAEPGISVWLDHTALGETTAAERGLQVPEVAAGEHTFRFSRNGYRTTVQRVSLKDGESLEIRLRLAPDELVVHSLERSIEADLQRQAPVVRLRSMPLAGRILLDGRDLGSGDLLVRNLGAGSHTVVFSHQGKELQKTFSTRGDDGLMLVGDFNQGKVLEQSSSALEGTGAETITLRSARGRKPAVFPHRLHQEMYDCGECHHGRDANGRRLSYAEGMPIQRCSNCHNASLMTKIELRDMKHVGHALCKGCHQREAQSGSAGPIDKCSGCHQ